jgi:AAA domain-containing protein
MARKNRPINLPAPYLKRVWLETDRVADRAAYPFCLPFLRDGLDIAFEHAITIIVGENGTGKSTLLAGIAALAGYDEAGGGKGYRPVDHSLAREKMGGELAKALRASWLPKITTGWFFRAESFFRWRAISTWLRLMIRLDRHRPIFCRIRMAKAFSGFLPSVAGARASLSSTSRSRRCRHRVRSNS